MIMLLEKIKKALRVSSIAFDEEISDLISAAQQDLKLSGVMGEKAISETDPLIIRAVTVYCKANFGFDNPDAEKLQESYKMIKTHLTLSAEYTVGDVSVMA
ncbi:head-tail connector protein [Paenibacillus puldeungensis]|uniref:Head-tail connector protein n=1 Tax=Paenibacillus puldeungensis TaxID=696536 RepID=A0ABW3RWM0_9BACL